MQELRLVGVQEDGGHLLLSNEDGEEFSLPVTDALRAAATRAADDPPSRGRAPPPWGSWSAGGRSPWGAQNCT